MIATTINPIKNSFVPEIAKKPIYLSWIVALSISLISVIFYFISQPQLPIFYSLATKRDQLAPKEFIFVFPVVSLWMNASHLFVIKILKNYSLLMLKLFAITTAFLQIIFLISLLRIILITI
ncbi:MAG: hypothetical protein H6772_01205 [Pseudomonadales bacterium]|nr:hypothetical protein [Pseudomonadales bacterium]